ncbi:copine-7 [Plakobranchus ocellatus]|uniref:Copine-7 n=1 Tax=Plakobranchus ocellatus TaxID=259542 RepID=A0AAV3ZDH9_9GAST|nr:copine-7 [Plakobranchus ocellatus]
MQFDVFDWDGDGGHDLIGNFTCTFQELCKALDDEISWPCINEKKKAKKSSYKNSGTVILHSLKIERVYSFLDYLFGGLQINLTFGVDFTASNGAVDDPSSLHYIDYQYPNEYMQAISAVGTVLQDYDADKRFPAYGFGAKIPPNMEASFAFPLTFNFSNPYCEGLQHVLDAYSYHILLLLTDGVLSDMSEVRDALVQASSLPLSLIIVGVGDANFRDMNILDGDDGVLKSTKGHPAKRDIVQFVPFRDFKQKTPSELACHVLAEIPKQVTGYFKMRGLPPKDPGVGSH